MEKRSEAKIEHDRANGLFVGEDWLRRDGFIKDANILKRLRNYVPLANLWVIILIVYHETGVAVDAYLHDSSEKPDASKAAQYVLGRELQDNEGVIVKGPFLWPDMDDERYIAEILSERTAVAKARPQVQKETVRDADLRPEPITGPENLAQAGQKT